MSDRPAPVRDARTLLGMDTEPAWAVAAFYLCALAALAVTSWGELPRRWPVVLALAIVTAATVVLLAAREDPLSRPLTVALALSIPLGSALVLFNLPPDPDPMAMTWHFGGGSVTATFLCVRGRSPAAWIGLCAMVAVSAAWASHAGYGAGRGLEMSVINFGPLLMSTFFAYTLRPAARQIFQLHEESLRQAAADAAATAALEVHREQTAGLDRIVRPMLDRIAGPEPLDERDRAECRLVEAQLRDNLRAPALSVPAIAAAARAARARGVEVVLVDDRGLDDAAPAVRSRLIAQITTELAGALAGSVMVRVLPPNRRLLATVVVDGPDGGIRRVEIGRDGRPQEHKVPPPASEDSVEAASVE
ncbi:MAG TPA: hypothetical protein VK083_03080 [Nocardia sp.]|uniref:hypothetical protein n=1 Tax=Nocardia sp. TaxID=1821 RepID=UPI002B4B73DA|nr:hypothetical protein [Nocardia sp.]HLS75762.1 hypothetical protein [Nocardia sp.]